MTGTVADLRVPNIGPGFRFQWEPAQECFVLLYPEGMVRLNQTAGAILNQCDGKTNVDDIVAALEQAFAATGLRRDVTAFLDMASQKRWIAWT